MALSRGIPGAMLAALASPVIYPVLMVDLDWPSGRVRAHSGRGVLSYGGHSWAGVGPFAEVRLPGDSNGFAAQKGFIRIVGDLSDLFDANEEEVKNRTAQIYSGVLSGRAGSALAADPVMQFNGHMSGTLIEGDEVGQHWLTLSLGSGPGARISARANHSHEDQSAEFPGDTAGRHTALAGPNAAKLVWPE